MKIVVLMKQTFDTETRINLNEQGAIDETGVNYVVNPFCEIATEEAIRIKEQLGEGEVIIVSVGPDRTEAAMRQCFAMGADRGVLISDPALEGGDEYTTALVLAKALSNMEYDLLLAGCQAVDDGSAQVGARVAELLNIPQGTIVTELELGSGKAIATRELDDGHEVIEVSLPALFTAQRALAEPRYPSMRGVIKAKKKPIQHLTLADLGISADEVAAKGARVKGESLVLPEPRQAGRIIDGEPEEAVAELVQLLSNEAKVF